MERKHKIIIIINARPCFKPDFHSRFSPVAREIFRNRFTKIKKFLRNGRPTVLSGLREDRQQYVLKTRTIELQTYFSLATVFRWNSKKVEINFSPEILFSNEK